MGGLYTEASIRRLLMIYILSYAEILLKTTIHIKGQLHVDTYNNYSVKDSKKAKARHSNLTIYLQLSQISIFLVMQPFQEALIGLSFS